MRAGLVRFRPVILTAITTVLGMTPMAVGVALNLTTLSIDTDSSTSFFWAPMALAVIFGLSFATILSLIIVPVMYYAQELFVRWLKRLTARLKGDEKQQSENT